MTFILSGMQLLKSCSVERVQAPAEQVAEIPQERRWEVCMVPYTSPPSEDGWTSGVVVYGGCRST